MFFVANMGVHAELFQIEADIPPVEFPRLLRRLAGVARIGAHVLDHERLARRERPAHDPGVGWDAAPDKRAGALPCHGLEDKLVGLFVEQGDGRGPRGEDGPRHLDDRLQQRAVVLLGGHDPRGHRRAQPILAHASPPTFDAVRYRTLLSWNGVSSGCFDRISVQIPAMWGAILFVILVSVCFFLATERIERWLRPV